MRAGSRADGGQTSGEFLGLVVVIAIVIAILAPGGFGSQIAGGIQAAICRIMGGGCTNPATAVSHQPTDKCTVLSHSGEFGLDVVAFSVDLGGSAKLTLTKKVDSKGQAHWYVAQQGDGRLGADVMVGEEAGLGDLGEGVKGEVKALLTGSGSQTMEFPTEQAARDFMTAAAHQPIKDAIAGWDPFGITHWALDQIDGHHYAPPPATEWFVEGGAKIDGSLSAKAGVASVGAKASVAGVVGVKYSVQPDSSVNHTVYVKLTAEAAATLGVFDVAKGELGAKDEVVVGIEYDATGKPVNASVEAAGTLKAQLGPDGAAGPKSTLTEIAGFAPKAAPKIGNGLGGGVQGKIKFNIDLRQGNNAAVLADGLHSIGVPVLTSEGSASPPNPVDGLTGVYGLFDQGAPGTSVALTSYDITTDNYTGTVKGGDGLTFGVDGGLKFEDSTLRDASYYEPGQGFVTWQQCYR